MFRSITLFVAVCLAIVVGKNSISTDTISEQSMKLHFSSIVLDTHDDTTQLFFNADYDLARRNPIGQVDIPRMQEGGMNAIFFFDLDRWAYSGSSGHSESPRSD